MELSKNQKLLIELCRTLEMSENLIISTMLAVKEPQRTNHLLDWIIDMDNQGKKIDKDKLVIRALEISQEDLEKKRNINSRVDRQGRSF